MGWTFVHRPKGIKERDYWQREFGEGWEVLDASKVRGTVYLAAKNHQTGLTSAAVILTQWVRDEYNFGYKDMDEAMGPCEAQAPERILNLLSPIEELYGDGQGAEWARRWRADCRAYNAKPKVVAGTKLRFTNPGSESLRNDLIGRTFVREPGRRALFTDTESLVRYRIPFYRNLSYEEVT